MMKFSKEQIDALRLEVKERLSEKRFVHTLGVEKMAALIGGKIVPDLVDELRVAALLHDISKEYSEAEHILALKKHDIALSDDDMAIPAMLHSITAPIVVRNEFSDFADEVILSAVYNHTVGSPDMTLFDEIIFLSDYIEEGRRYKVCVDLRDKFLSELSVAESTDEAVIALHRAAFTSINNTISQLAASGQSCHSRTLSTRDAILSKIERQNNGKY